MNNKIILKINNEIVNECNSNLSVLDNILNKNLHLNHSCKNGRCDSCKVKIINGSFEIIKNQMSIDDEDKNIHLSCCIRPKSNMTILADSFRSYSLPKSKIYPVKVKKMINHNIGIKSIFLKMPKDINFNFVIGQYIDIKIFETYRSYSISSFNPKGNIIEIIVKYLDKGLLSNYWFNKCKLGDLLLMEGPKGGNTLNLETNAKNLILVATGVGISPILAIIKSKNIHKKFKKVYVIWGNRYQVDEFLDIYKYSKKIIYLKTFSKNKGNKFKYVQDVINDKFDSLKDSFMYSCGSYDMVKDVNNLSLEKGLIKNNFISDAFVQTGD